MNTSPLAALLNVFWLRPETALWRAIDIHAMRNFTFASPSLDLGCGDGVFSFIRAGGAFDPAYDAFKIVAGLDQFFDNVDVHDAYDASMSPQVSQKPSYTIDWAFDQKANLLKKAEGLGLYKNFSVGDANQPLPFESGSFATVFSNIVYWLDDPQLALSEISRVLRPGGRACLMLPNATFPSFSFYHQLYIEKRDARWEFLGLLDRGRFSDNIKQALPAEQWEERFRAASLAVHSHGRHLSKTNIQIWDIGLRPLFPMLHKMASAVEPARLQEIKKDWVALLGSLLEPLAAMDPETTQGAEPAFHCYILEKQ